MNRATSSTKIQSKINKCKNIIFLSIIVLVCLITSASEIGGLQIKIPAILNLFLPLPHFLLMYTVLAKICFKWLTKYFCWTNWIKLLLHLIASFNCLNTYGPEGQPGSDMATSNLFPSLVRSWIISELLWSVSTFPTLLFYLNFKAFIAHKGKQI